MFVFVKSIRLHSSFLSGVPTQKVLPTRLRRLAPMIDEECPRESIENHVRLEPPLHEEVLLVRGGPFGVEKLIERARRQQRRYSF
jgi:hypothetical protein